MYIARFLSLNDAVYIFEEDTFCLNSLWLYRKIEKKSVRDPYELILKGENEEGEMLDNFLVSCWTMIRDSNIESNDWNIFPDKNHFAIISKVEKVEKFLLDRLRKFIVQDNLKHKRVFYYNETDTIEELLRKLQLQKEDDKHKQRQKILSEAPFLKISDFQKQREYRFVISGLGNIKSLIFYASEPREYNWPCCRKSTHPYIEKIYINPRLKKDNYDDYERLKDMIIKSGLSNISNPNILEEF